MSISTTLTWLRTKDIPAYHQNSPNLYDHYLPGNDDREKAPAVLLINTMDRVNDDSYIAKRVRNTNNLKKISNKVIINKLTLYFNGIIRAIGILK